MKVYFLIQLLLVQVLLLTNYFYKQNSTVKLICLKIQSWRLNAQVLWKYCSGILLLSVPSSINSVYLTFFLLFHIIIHWLILFCKSFTAKNKSLFLTPWPLYITNILFWLLKLWLLICILLMLRNSLNVSKHEILMWCYLLNNKNLYFQMQHLWILPADKVWNSLDQSSNKCIICGWHTHFWMVYFSAHICFKHYIMFWRYLSWRKLNVEENIVLDQSGILYCV